MDAAPERIDGDRMIELLQSWIDTRRLCKMTIPDTEYVWITMILNIETGKSPSGLLVDKVKGAEGVLSHYVKKGLRFEFLEKDGVLCWFQTRFVQSRPSAFLTQLPESIFRLQRRKFVRMNARSGTEIRFQRSNGTMVIAKVKDYGLGGVSFFTPPLTVLTIDEWIGEVDLKIPHEDGWKHFHIPVSRVRRLEKTEGGGGLCALEFIEIPEAEKEQMWHAIFQEQRLQLRKTGKI